MLIVGQSHRIIFDDRSSGRVGELIHSLVELAQKLVNLVENTPMLIFGYIALTPMYYNQKKAEL